MQNLISFEEICNVIENKNIKNVAILSSRSTYKLSLLDERFRKVLPGCKLKTILISVKNLSVEDVENIKNELGNFNPDLFISVGGGSVVDACKIVNLVISQNITTSDLMSKDYGEVDLKPTIAIPSTSGSGSEATQFAVVYKNNVKHSILSSSLLPNYVVLKPEFTMTMDKNLAAVTGFDAFSQAIESYWSVNSTEESKEYSIKSLELIRKYLKTSVLKGDKVSREKIQEAAYLAGKAINISKTTICHAISYPLSAYFKIPHGLAVFLVLPSVFKFNIHLSNSDCLDSRGVEYVQNTLNEISELVCFDNMSLDDTFKMYMDDFGFSCKLSDYGIKSTEDIEKILQNGFSQERAKNNPREMNKEQLNIILQEIK